jgi:hypothetical protein
VAATLIALSVVAILLLVLYVRGRGKRTSTQETHEPSKPEKFNTTLGEFHDMREALRPLEHRRAASRRDPNGRR